MKSIKSDSDEQKKVVSFSGENKRGDTAELATKKVAAPGVTHPSDTIDRKYT